MQAFDWWGWLARQGVFAAMLIGSAIWFANDIVIPMRDGQTKFMESVIEANRINAQTNSNNALVNQQNAGLLSKVIDSQGAIVTTQKSVIENQTKIMEMHHQDLKYRDEYLKVLEQIRDNKKG